MAQWIASLRASPAKTFPSRAGALVLMASGPGSSSTSSTSLTLAVRENSFWRTLQGSLLPQPPLWTKPAPPIMPPTPLRTELLLWVEKMDAYSNARPPASWGSFPTAGGMRSGSLFQRPTWAPATVVSDGSALPGAAWMTPSVSYSQGNEYTRDRGEIGSERLTLTGQAAHWPTPRGTDGPKGGPNQAGSKGDLTLPSMAAQWPTPSAAVMNDAESPQSWRARAQRLKDKGINGNGAGLPLTIAAKAWPTPNAHVIEHKRTPPIVDGTRQPTDPQISTADYAVHVFPQTWPTPNSRDHKGSDLPSRNGGASVSHAAEQGVFSHSSPQDPQMVAGLACSPSTRTSPLRLNPAFGEWLMGWPSQWTRAEPNASSASATALWRSRLQSQLSSLLGELEA